MKKPEVELRYDTAMDELNELILNQDATYPRT